jgi:hypothetical protein
MPVSVPIIATREQAFQLGDPPSDDLSGENRASKESGVKRTIVVLAILLAAPFAFAECTKSTSCGTTIQDSLDFESGACLDSETRRYIVYSFNADNGATISVNVSSPIFPPAVQLINPQLQIVADDENPSQLTAANVSAMNVPYTGTWYAKVRNVNIGDGGLFSLKITCGYGAPPPPPPPPPTDFRIQVNPGTLTLARNQSASVTVTSIIQTNTTPVTLIPQTPPSGITVSVDPKNLPAPGSGQAMMTIGVGGSVPAGIYVVGIDAFNSAGSKRTAAVSLTVFFDCKVPFLLRQPSDRTVKIGQRARLTADPDGSQPMNFQWYLGDSGDETFPVIGQNGPVMTTDVFPILNTYHYWFEAQNECGMARSRTIVVTVTPVRSRPVRRR